MKIDKVHELVNIANDYTYDFDRFLYRCTNDFEYKKTIYLPGEIDIIVNEALIQAGDNSFLSDIYRLSCEIIEGMKSKTITNCIVCDSLLDTNEINDNEKCCGNCAMIFESFDNIHTLLGFDCTIENFIIWCNEVYLDHIPKNHSKFCIVKPKYINTLWHHYIN